MEELYVSLGVDMEVVYGLYGGRVCAQSCMLFAAYACWKHGHCSLRGTKQVVSVIIPRATLLGDYRVAS